MPRTSLYLAMLLSEEQGEVFPADLQRAQLRTKNHFFCRLSLWVFAVLCSGNNANVKSMTGAAWSLGTAQGRVAQALTLALT